MTRLPDTDTASGPSQVRDTLAALPDLSLFRVIAHAETAFVPWLTLGGALLGSLALDPMLRELVILQVATSTGSDYERVQHEAIAAGTGVSAEQVAAVVGARLDDPSLAHSAPVLRVVAELVRIHTTSPAGLDTLRTRLGDRQTVEVLLVVGFYLGVALLAAAVDLDPDPPAQMAVIDAAATTGQDKP
jgi:alkylhydroperoxidase family enzyme